MGRDELLALADEILAIGRGSNEHDVRAEVALFQPGICYTSCRANAAGTKVIYTDKVGNQVTCWADDWTSPHRRYVTAAALRALAHHAEHTADSAGKGE